MVNDKRKELGLEPLACKIAEIIDNQSTGDKLSSTDFRRNIAEICEEKDFEKLKFHWDNLAQIYKINEDLSIIWFWRLMNLYSETWRTYHNIGHLIDGVQKIEKYCSEFSKEDQALQAATLFFHDAIYIPWAKGNEKVLFITNPIEFSSSFPRIRKRYEFRGKYQRKNRKNHNSDRKPS